MLACASLVPRSNVVPERDYLWACAHNLTLYIRKIESRPATDIGFLYPVVLAKIQSDIRRIIH